MGGLLVSRGFDALERGMTALSLFCQRMSRASLTDATCRTNGNFGHGTTHRTKVTVFVSLVTRLLCTAGPLYAHSFFGGRFASVSRVPMHVSRWKSFILFGENSFIMKVSMFVGREGM